jgi:hypothetical protein
MRNRCTLVDGTATFGWRDTSGSGEMKVHMAPAASAELQPNAVGDGEPSWKNRLFIFVVGWNVSETTMIASVVYRGHSSHKRKCESPSCYQLLLASNHHRGIEARL